MMVISRFHFTFDLFAFEVIRYWYMYNVVIIRWTLYHWSWQRIIGSKCSTWDVHWFSERHIFCSDFANGFDQVLFQQSKSLCHWFTKLLLHFGSPLLHVTSVNDCKLRVVINIPTPLLLSTLEADLSLEESLYYVFVLMLIMHETQGKPYNIAKCGRSTRFGLVTYVCRL